MLNSRNSRCVLPWCKRLLPFLVVAALVPVAMAFQDFEAEKLRIAAAQHEIIQILLKEKNFDAVFPELDKIFDLRIASAHEDKVVREVRLVAEAFLYFERSDLAIRALQKGIQGVTQNRNKALLFQETGYVHRLQGNDLKAMECFRRAEEYSRKLSTRPQ